MTRERKQTSLVLRKQSSAKSEEIDSFILILKLGYKFCSGLLQCFSLFFLIPSLSEAPYIIYLPLNDLDPPFVDHPGHYLSACCIGHPLWPSVSWDSQGSTVQGSSPHKCGQKVSCRAFNAVAVAFSQIFPSFHSFITFIIHAPISEVSCRVTLSDGICIQSVLRLSEETVLLRLPFPTFLSTCYLWDFELNNLTIVYWSSD